MSYLTAINIRHTAKRARHNRIKARFIKKYGTRGSENLFALTGKQAARYAKADRQDNLARYGKTGF